MLYTIKIHNYSIVKEFSIKLLSEVNTVVLLKELLNKFDTNVNMTSIDDALLNTGYDKELSPDNFNYTSSTEEGRNKHTFTDDGVTLILWENPFYLIINVINEDGTNYSQEFDESGNVVALS